MEKEHWSKTAYDWLTMIFITVIWFIVIPLLIIIGLWKSSISVPAKCVLGIITSGMWMVITLVGN